METSQSKSVLLLLPLLLLLLLLPSLFLGIRESKFRCIKRHTFAILPWKIGLVAVGGRFAPFKGASVVVLSYWI
jgi:hypothetical protein